MVKRFFTCLIISFVVAAASYTAAGDWVLAPAPADLPALKGARTHGKLKRDKWGRLAPSPDVVSLKYLPKDKYGFVDWTKSLKEGVIAPRDSLFGDAPKKAPSYNEGVIIRSKMDFMPDVLFPHSVHNDWLNCSPCHTRIFKMKAGATPISMTGIWKGKFCGRCHDRVAFPIRNCFKCHSVKRKAPE